MIRHRRATPQSSGRQASPNLRQRRRLVALGLTLAFCAVSATVFYRQVIETDYLRDQGERRYLRTAEIPARRGIIMDRNGEPLAVSTPVETLSANPAILAGHLDDLAPLARALNLDPAGLRARVADNAKRGFMYLKRWLSFEEAKAARAVLARQHLGGIYFTTEYKRYYPGGEVFGHVIGSTDSDDKGIEGLELEYEAQLKARPGKRRVVRDGRGNIIREVEQIRAPESGRDLVLSLDRRLQFLAYRALKSAVATNRAKGGTVVVLDVTSGEVLAMVNQPGYNPNADRGASAERRRNRALTDVMEPGSTIKPLVVAAALERGLVAPHTPIETSPGRMKVGKHQVKDIHNYGLLDVTGVITKSSNVGVVKIAQMMDPSALGDLFDAVGFGQPTGIPFPGEVGGILRPHTDWRPFEYATHAFGYGLSVTAMQLAQAYAVLAADGVKRPLTLLKRDTRPHETRVLGVDTARAVRRMMETVISEKGTAKRAQIPGYRAGGKTGTARKSAGRRGYSRKHQSVFAGFVPTERPRLVMVVMIDEPGRNAYYGGLVAAPVFRRVMEDALRLFNVPPDELPPSMQLAHDNVNRVLLGGGAP